MIGDEEGYLVDGQSLREVAGILARDRGRLPTLPGMKRRRYNNIPQQAYIVTQTQTDKSLGIGANCAITKRGISTTTAASTSFPDATFLAKPYSAGATLFGQLTGDEVKVFTRFISGAICTGQLFMFTPQIGEGPQDTDVAGDVAICPNGFRWYGLWRAKGKGAQGLAEHVDLLHMPDIRPAGYQGAGVFLGSAVAPIIAVNNTGQTFFDGQLVYVDWTDFGFMINDFTCRGF